MGENPPSRVEIEDLLSNLCKLMPIGESHSYGKIDILYKQYYGQKMPKFDCYSAKHALQKYLGGQFQFYRSDAKDTKVWDILRTNPNAPTPNKLTGPYQLFVTSVVSSTQAVISWQIPEQWREDDYKIEATVDKYFHDNTQFINVEHGQRSIDIDLAPGDRYHVQIKIHQDNTVISKGESHFKAVHNVVEMEQLYEKAMIAYGNHNEHYRFTHFHREKESQYFDDILYNKQGIMRKEKKNRIGKLGSPINGQMNGLFFSGTLRRNGDWPRFFRNGNKRFTIEAQHILPPTSNLYFADFYCQIEREKPGSDRHHVTLVATIPESETDIFCAKRLIQIDLENNPFLKVINRGYNRTPDYSIHANDLGVHVIYTEDVTFNHGQLLDIKVSEDFNDGFHKENYNPFDALIIGKGGFVGKLCPICQINYQGRYKHDFDDASEKIVQKGKVKREKYVKKLSEEELDEMITRLRSIFDGCRLTTLLFKQFTLDYYAKYETNLEKPKSLIQHYFPKDFMFSQTRNGAWRITLRSGVGVDESDFASDSHSSTDSDSDSDVESDVDASNRSTEMEVESEKEDRSWSTAKFHDAEDSEIGSDVTEFESASESEIDADFGRKRRRQSEEESENEMQIDHKSQLKMRSEPNSFLDEIIGVQNWGVKQSCKLEALPNLYKKRYGKTLPMFAYKKLKDMIQEKLAGHFSVKYSKERRCQTESYMEIDCEILKERFGIERRPQNQDSMPMPNQNRKANGKPKNKRKRALIKKIAGFKGRFGQGLGIRLHEIDMKMISDVISMRIQPKYEIECMQNEFENCGYNIDRIMKVLKLYNEY